MSEIDQMGGVQHFSKMSEIQKCPKGRRVEGGVNPNWDICMPSLNLCYFNLDLRGSINFPTVPRYLALYH